MFEYSTRISHHVPEFDIKPYLTSFRKRNFTINNLIDINKLLVSQEYQIFINSVYDSFEPKDFILAGEIINSFWKALISKDLLEKFNNNLKKELKI